MIQNNSLQGIWMSQTSLGLFEKRGFSAGKKIESLEHMDDIMKKMNIKLD